MSIPVSRFQTLGLNWLNYIMSQLLSYFLMEQLRNWWLCFLGHQILMLWVDSLSGLPTRNISFWWPENTLTLEPRTWEWDSILLHNETFTQVSIVIGILDKNSTLFSSTILPLMLWCSVFIYREHQKCVLTSHSVIMDSKPATRTYTKKGVSSVIK